MNTAQIIRLLENDPVTREHFEGVFASDRLPETVRRLPSCVVFNTAPLGRHGHWIALYINSAGEGSYMDSYGRAPRRQFLNFLKRNCADVEYNTRRLQGHLTTTCGYYCMVFLVWMCRGGRMTDFVEKFTDDLPLNDYSITKTINKLYNVQFKVVDASFYSTLL